MKHTLDSILYIFFNIQYSLKNPHQIFIRRVKSNFRFRAFVHFAEVHYPHLKISQPQTQTPDCDVPCSPSRLHGKASRKLVSCLLVFLGGELGKVI